jgi:hypothetical protein
VLWPRNDGAHALVTRKKGTGSPKLRKLMTRSREIAPAVVVASMARRGAARLRHEMVASVGCMGSSSGKGANGEVAWHEASGGKAARGRCSCNRTDQIIRAQVQKQAPKRSNFRT